MEEPLDSKGDAFEGETQVLSLTPGAGADSIFGYRPTGRFVTRNCGSAYNGQFEIHSRKGKGCFVPLCNERSTRWSLFFMNATRSPKH